MKSTNARSGGGQTSSGVVQKRPRKGLPPRLEALARYWQSSLAATREALADDRPLDEALMFAYEAALFIYFFG